MHPCSVRDQLLEDERRHVPGVHWRLFLRRRRGCRLRVHRRRGYDTDSNYDIKQGCGAWAVCLLLLAAVCCFGESRASRQCGQAMAALNLGCCLGAPSRCAENFYKVANGDCKPCKGDATSEGGKVDTCKCVVDVLKVGGDYDKTTGCGEGLGPQCVPQLLSCLPEM